MSNAMNLPSFHWSKPWGGSCGNSGYRGSGGSDANWPRHGSICWSLLWAESQHLRWAGHLLHPVLLHHHAQHSPPQLLHQDEYQSRLLTRPMMTSTTLSFPLLLKQEGSLFWKTWKRRWFVLNDRCLYYFVHSAHTRSNFPEGIIPLENIRVRPVEDQDGKQFEIYPEMAEIIKECITDTVRVLESKFDETNLAKITDWK